MTKILVDYNFNNNELYNNDEMIKYFINAHKMRYNNPSCHICIYINNKFLKNNEQMYRLLCNIYDRVIESGDTNNINKIKKEYDIYDHKEYESLNKDFSVTTEYDDDIDTNYHFYQLKKELGPIIRNSHIFREKEIDIMMKGGFNFNNNKIKYKDKSFDPRTKVICDLYKVDCNQIKLTNYDYYHLIPNAQYRPFHLTPMFDNIKEFDYINPLKILSEYYDYSAIAGTGSYYDELYNNIKSKIDINNKPYQRLNLYDSIEANVRDSVMLQYIKCRKDCFILSIWKPAIGSGTNGLNQFIDYLETLGNIYYVKTISLSKRALRNLLFWMYDDFTYTTRLEFIEKKLGYIDTYDDNNEAMFIIFDNVKNHKISGQGSSFKTQLRNKLLELTQLDTNKYRGNDILHINDYFYQTVEYAQIILNDNTLEMLNHQDCRKYIDKSYQLTNLKIQTFRKIIYSNCSLLEIDRLLIMGGYVLYSYGIRPFTDIDAIMIKNNSQDKSTRLMKFIEDNFVIQKSKLYFGDIGIEGSSHWRESWDVKNKMVYDFFGITSSSQITLDPKNHCYNQGFKITIIDFEIIRKLIRNRTQDHVDLIMISSIDPKLIHKYLVPRHVSAIAEYKNQDQNQIGLNKFFIIPKEVNDISGEYYDDDKTKFKILYNKFSTNDIVEAKKTYLFKAYFSNHK